MENKKLEKHLECNFWYLVQTKSKKYDVEDAWNELKKIYFENKENKNKQQEKLI